MSVVLWSVWWEEIKHGRFVAMGDKLPIKEIHTLEGATCDSCGCKPSLGYSGLVYICKHFLVSKVLGGTLCEPCYWVHLVLNYLLYVGGVLSTAALTDEWCNGRSLSLRGSGFVLFREGVPSPSLPWHWDQMFVGAKGILYYAKETPVLREVLMNCIVRSWKRKQIGALEDERGPFWRMCEHASMVETDFLFFLRAYIGDCLFDEWIASEKAHGRMCDDEDPPSPEDEVHNLA